VRPAVDDLVLDGPVLEVVALVLDDLPRYAQS
jgi:hypothetical protein